MKPILDFSNSFLKVDSMFIYNTVCVCVCVPHANVNIDFL